MKGGYYLSSNLTSSSREAAGDGIGLASINTLVYQESSATSWIWNSNSNTNSQVEITQVKEYFSSALDSTWDWDSYSPQRGSSSLYQTFLMSTATNGIIRFDKDGANEMENDNDDDYSYVLSSAMSMGTYGLCNDDNGGYQDNDFVDSGSGSSPCGNLSYSLNLVNEEDINQDEEESSLQIEFLTSWYGILDSLVFGLTLEKFNCLVGDDNLLFGIHGFFGMNAPAPNSEGSVVLYAIDTTSEDNTDFTTKQILYWSTQGKEDGGNDNDNTEGVLTLGYFESFVALDTVLYNLTSDLAYANGDYQYSVIEEQHSAIAKGYGTYGGAWLGDWEMTAAPWIVSVQGDEYVNAVGRIECDIDRSGSEGSMSLYVDNNEGTAQFFTRDAVGWEYTETLTHGYVQDFVEVGNTVYANGSAILDYGQGDYSMYVKETQYDVTATGYGTYGGSWLGDWEMTAAPWIVSVQGDEYVNAVGRIECDIDRSGSEGSMSLYVDNNEGTAQFYTKDALAWSHKCPEDATCTNGKYGAFGFIEDIVQVNGQTYANGTLSASSQCLL